MAHQLTTNKDGKVEMFYYGEKPWHELGTSVGSALTSAEAIQTASLDWEVGKADVSFDPISNSQFYKVPGKYVTYRKDNNTPLGVVGKDYTILQNKDAFSFFDAIVGEKAAMYHTAGSLFDGRKIWLLAKMPKDIVVKGVDLNENYLLLSNAHDGSQQIKIMWTTVRVVCNNTLTQALGGVENNKMCKVKHTQNMGNKVSKIKELLGLANNMVTKFEEYANQLASIQANTEVVEEFLDNIGLKYFDNDAQAARTRKENTRYDIYRSFDETGKETPEIKGTKWALLNGYTDFIDHNKFVKNNEDKWVDNILFGTASDHKRKAMEILLK